MNCRTQIFIFWWLKNLFKHEKVFEWGTSMTTNFSFLIWHQRSKFFIIKIEWEIFEPLNLEEFFFLWKFSQLSFNSESFALKILLNILFPPFHVKLNVWGNFLCSISTRQSCKCFFSLAAFFYCLVANATTWSRIFYFILCLKSGITMILMMKVRVWWEWKTEKVERFIGDGNF